MNDCRLPIADCRLPAELKLSGREAFATENRKSKIVNAFTLVEMLVVISILGLLAALTVPALKNLGKSNASISASRQMLDGVGRARQLAIANHTTVYMIFVPTNFWVAGGQFPNNWWSRLTSVQQTVATNLCDKQLSGYTFVAYGAAGDQPGRHLWHYLDRWQGLPEGSFIAQWKFGPRNSTKAVVDPATGASYPVQGFATTQIPFPTENFPNGLTLQYLPPFPYISFNYLGQLTSGQDEYIPLARGSVLPAIDPSTKAFQLNSPSVSETPPGNSVSAFNLIHIDWLTGRADLKFQKVQ